MYKRYTGCLSYAPNWGLGLQPRLVPWLGIKPATPLFTGRHSVHWATPARVHLGVSTAGSGILGSGKDSFTGWHTTSRQGSCLKKTLQTMQVTQSSDKCKTVLQVGARLYYRYRGSRIIRTRIPLARYRTLPESDQHYLRFRGNTSPFTCAGF